MKSNAIQFIIHRGSHQIGGNCVELATQNTRILIDCGLPLDFEKQAQETQEKILEDAKEWTQNCDAIFLSHYHADHYGLLNEAPEGTKVYATKETAELMKISGVFVKDLTKHLDIQPIENTVTVKDFRVTAFPVDHSAFGACAFLFEVGGKTILYSGDIRLHGKKGILYKMLPKHVDYLFLEGTNIGRGVKQKTEKDMENEFVSQFMANKDSLHLVWCSSQNIDRIVDLYRACIKTNRILCVDLYAAYVLKLVNASNDKIPSIKTHDNLMIYFPHRLTSLLIEKDEKLVYGLRQGATKLVKGDLSVNPSKYVVLFRPKLLGDLGRYINNTKVCLTTSIWAQYWEQDKPEMKRLKAWLVAKPELRKRLRDIHTSGHADVESLQEIVEHIQPKTIIPIHTEHSESFSSLFPNNSVMEVADEICYSITD
jgi:ribonuclease J